jgi:hypothetical protein
MPKLPKLPKLTAALLTFGTLGNFGTFGNSDYLIVTSMICGVVRVTRKCCDGSNWT